jgi:hypothetical protein
VSLLRNLSTIQLSDAIFQNPSFALLKDINITFPAVTNQGRRNPFAVVGGDNAVLPATQSASTTSVIVVPTSSTGAATAPSF